MKADLHVHTLASDGTMGPSELVVLAARLGLDAIAITDHDSVEGVAPALAAGSQEGLVVVPGVELSAYDDTGRDFHILGYFIDYTDPAFQDRLLHLRHARLERAVKMVESLTDAGFELSVDDVLRLASTDTAYGGPNGAVGRSHIARALVDAGHVESVQDAFERLIGRRQPHYVSKPLAPPEEVVRAITEVGGTAVLAHPAVNDAHDKLDLLVQAGLGGIEAHHFEHDTHQTAELVALARGRDLIVTGGSDFHDPNGRGPGLGGVIAPPDAVELLRAASS